MLTLICASYSVSRFINNLIVNNVGVSQDVLKYSMLPPNKTALLSRLMWYQEFRPCSHSVFVSRASIA